MENWAKKRSSRIYEKALTFYDQIVSAYENRQDADNSIEEGWNIFNAIPDDNQVYQGNTQSYVPAVRDAISARSKRALKQLFPLKYKHVEAVGTQPDEPTAQLALLEHYIRKTHLKSICRSMLVAGDVTGQWNLYIDWKSTEHRVAASLKANPIMKTVEGASVELEDPEDEKEPQFESVVKECPVVRDFAVEDLVVIPPTVSDIEDADVTCVKLRMTKELVKQFIKDGVFVLKDKESDLSEWISGHKSSDSKNPNKKRSGDAGISTRGTDSYACIYEAHVRMDLDGDGNKSLVYIYYAGKDDIIGIIRAPQWGQRRPVICAPVERVQGSFFGKSRIEPVKRMQWNLNDFWNMGQDSAMYSMLPIIMTNPEANPNYAAMVFGLAAVWPVDPKSTQFSSFPPLWKDSIMMCSAIKSQIWESMDVNEMMMGRMPAGRKNNRLMAAQQAEQSVDVMDHASRFEEEILNPLMERIFEYDAQYRDKALTVLTQGELGVKAAMKRIEPQQWGERYDFQWSGTSFVMSMQLMQQQIATMNVLRGIPPQQLNGLTLNVAPILKLMVENVFGPELGGQILVDERNKFTVDPSVEDEMMINGIPAQVHQADNDIEHIKVHQSAGAATGDQSGLIRSHIQDHVKALQIKEQARIGAQQQRSPSGLMGMPGGARPGVPGTPRPGAQPAPQRIVQQPPGAARPDEGRG